MSYDIYLSPPDNIGPMFNLAFGGYWVDIINGEVAREVHLKIDKAVKEMEESPNKYKALEPKNGWGSYEGALKYLKKLNSECWEHPDYIINIYK